MNKYVAFLRAINVGGRTVKMGVLVEIFESLKLRNIKTYIQSGNISFETTVKDPDILRDKIENKLQASLGYEVKVVLRTIEELKQVVEHNPFKDNTPDENIRVYIAFLYSIPGKEIKDIVDSLNNKNESYYLTGSEVYCRIHKDEKDGGFLSVLQLEKKLGKPMTMRNQTTVNKINILLNK